MGLMKEENKDRGTDKDRENKSKSSRDGVREGFSGINPAV